MLELSELEVEIFTHIEKTKREIEEELASTRILIERSKTRKNKTKFQKPQRVAGEATHHRRTKIAFLMFSLDLDHTHTLESHYEENSKIDEI